MTIFGIMSKSDILLDSVKKFFEDQKNSTILIDILEKRKGVSLRHLEWFITNYAKKEDINYRTKDGRIFSVHCSYKSTLDGYSKKLFDPFCRKNKIQFTVPNTDKEITTTVAQLNFIKWCITNDIIDQSKVSRCHQETSDLQTCS